MKEENIPTKPCLTAGLFTFSGIGFKGGYFTELIITIFLRRN